MHLIYEGNKYEFDIPNGVTISYIKDLISKIFHNEEKDLNIIYNDVNLLNYNNKVLISTIVPKGEKTMIIHLEKKESLIKNLINSSNVSTSDTNVNDKYYKSMKKNFNSSYYNIIKEISHFSSNLESIIKKLIKTIKSFKDNVISVNNKFNQFYNNKNYSKLIEAFEEKQINNLNEKELKNLNNEIESYHINYKYLISQYKFHNNIIEFIQEMNDKFKLGKINFLTIQKEENYEDIMSLLDNIFKELLPNNIKFNKINELENIINNNYLMTESNKKKKKPLFDFPKIENKIKEKTSNHFYTQSDKSILSNSLNEKSIKLFKKGMNNSSYNNLSLPSFISNNIKKSNKLFPIVLNKNTTRNVFLGLDNLKSIDTKTIDSSTTETKKKKNVIPKNSPINSHNKNEEYDIKNYNFNDKNNQSMNIEVKPKIMDKDIKNKILSRNEINDNNPVNKTFNHLFDKNESKYSLINLKPLKKNLNIIPTLYNYSYSKDFFQDNKKYSKTEREKKNNNISNFKDSNNNISYDNNSSYEKNRSESKEIKNKFKVVKKNSSEKNNNISNEKKEEKKSKRKTLLNENDTSKLNINFNSTIKSLKMIDFKKNKSLKSLFPDSISLQDNSKKNEKEGKKDNFGYNTLNTFKEKDDSKIKKKKKKKVIKNDLNDKKTKDNKSLFKEKKEENEIKRNSKSKKKRKNKENLEKNEEKDLNLNYNKRENNKEQIEKLTKDLIGNGKTFTNNQIPDIIKKDFDKDNNNDNENNDNKEIEKEEKEINLEDVKSEKTDEEGKKKKKRLINVYDFII